MSSAQGDIFSLTLLKAQATSMMILKSLPAFSIDIYYLWLVLQASVLLAGSVPCGLDAALVPSSPSKSNPVPCLQYILLPLFLSSCASQHDLTCAGWCWFEMWCLVGWCRLLGQCFSLSEQLGLVCQDFWNYFGKREEER